MDDATAPFEDGLPIIEEPFGDDHYLDGEGPPLETHRRGPENIEQYPVVEPFGDERDSTARLVALTDEPIEVLHSADRIETVKLGAVKFTFHMISDHGDRFDLRVTDTAGSIVWRDIFAATATGIDKAAKELYASKHTSSSRTAKTMVGNVVYRLLGVGASGGLVVENLFEAFDDDPDPMSVGPYVARDVASALVGPSGSTKSITAIAGAIARATGERIGPHVPVGGPEPVLILDGEASRRDLQEIAIAIARAHGIDYGDLERNGMIRYIRITGPIVGQAEELRSRIREQESGLLIVDSLDTARGPDATNQSGGYYDTLRFLGISSLSVDHVTGAMLDQGMSQWRALGSVRSTNRPRQTYALRTSRTPSKDEVVVTSRLNYVNRGRPGHKFKTLIRFEMTDAGRFKSIEMSEPEVVEQTALTQQDQVLVAITNLEAKDGDMTANAVMEATGLSRSQFDSSLAKLRNDGHVAKGMPLRLEPLGRNYLMDQWDTDLPDPSGGGNR